MSRGNNRLQPIGAVGLTGLLAVLAIGPLAGDSSAAPPPPPTDDRGFLPLFDGKTLAGWQGDGLYWSVRDGCILGQITPETLIDNNRFLIYQGEVPDDFELRLEYRISAEGNSGVNYRSEVVAGVGYHAMRGYQCDLDGAKRYVGSNYEERRRTTLARVGEAVVIPPARDESPGVSVKNAWSAREVVEQLGSPSDLRGSVKSADWNRVRIVARGNRLSHYLNGVLMSSVVDNDPKNRRLAGKLGVQVHVGPPMTVEYRHVRIRPLSE